MTNRPECLKCGLPLDDGALLHGATDCTSCALRGHVPAIGEPDPEALAWINSVWHRIPADAVFKRYGLPPIGLKQLIREEAEAMRMQAPFRARIIAEIERQTGLVYRPAVLQRATNDSENIPVLIPDLFQTES